jgi:hypothetical protein
MEKMERYRFAVGGAVMVLIMGLLAVLLGVPGTRRPVPTFEELAGPGPATTRLPSRQEILEGLPTLEELARPEPDTRLERVSALLAEWEAAQYRADVIEAMERQADALEATVEPTEQSSAGLSMGAPSSWVKL